LVFINFTSEASPPDTMDIGTSTIFFKDEIKSAKLDAIFPLFSPQNIFENIQEYQESLK